MRILGLAAACLAVVSAHAATSRVGVATYEWKDGARNREVPVKAYYPEEATNRCAVILVSHGLGGSRDGYEFLGRHWAAHGYVSLHLQHAGSDTAAWRDRERPMESMRAAASGSNALERLEDVRFALDRLVALDRDAGPLRGRLDTNRIGIAGHSFGANTALLAAGQGRAGIGNRADPRIRAAVALSSPAPAGATYDGVRIPVFHMTGTRDVSPIGETPIARRRVPFDEIRGVDQYLVTFEGGDHMVFSGQRLRGLPSDQDPVFHDLIRKGTLAFWDAYLLGEPRARAWLQDGGYRAALGESGRVEVKRGLAPRSD